VAHALSDEINIINLGSPSRLVTPSMVGPTLAVELGFLFLIIV